MAKKQSKPTAAVYDRWLHTLGGGEQVAFAYAEVLRDLGYQVSLLTHSKLDVDAAVQKMDVDLREIQIRYLPNLLDYQLSQYSAEYDLFISNSYMDYIPNLCKQGMLSVFFPSKISVNLYEYLKRAHIVPSLRKFFIYPTGYEGFRYDSFDEGKLHKWLGEESFISFNKNVDRLELGFYFKQLAFSTLDSLTFWFEKVQLFPSISVDHQNNTVQFSFDLRHISTIQRKLRIVLPPSLYSSDVSLFRLSIPHWRYLIYNVFKRIFPKYEMRLHGGPSITRYSDIESYQQIVTISKFSQYWINKYWHMKSKILYPPVSTTKFSPAKKKRNMIVNVGRFFVGGHSKKQLEMVRVFKKLVDAGHKNWELHLVGGVAQGSIHQQYLKKITEEAEEYPIFLHTDVAFHVLREVLAKAKIYWHATGLDENENKNPIMLEHFGITTVEAMASGCVPLVINKGGQPEIVSDGSGFIWQNRDELFTYTEQLMNNAQLLETMSQAAIKRSAHFSKAAFKKRLIELLPDMTI